MKSNPHCCRGRCLPWALVMALASPGSAALAIPQLPPETTASTSLRLVGEDIDPQIQNKLEAIDLLIRDGRYSEAETAAREALTELEASGQGKSVEATSYTDRLVEVLLKVGKGAQAETSSLAGRANELNERHFGSESYEAALSLDRLGRVMAARGDDEQALPVLQQALSMFTELGEPAAADVARVKRLIGKTYHQSWNLDAAEAWLNEALAAEEASPTPDVLELSKTLGALGDVLVYQDRTAEAITLLGRSVEQAESVLGPNHPEVAMSLTSLGQALRRNGDFDDARIVLERAVAILEAAELSDSVMAATVSAILGSTLTDLADYAGAVDLLERALEIRSATYGSDSDPVARTLNQLGALRAYQHQYERSAVLFHRAAEIMEALFGNTSEGLAMVLGNQALATAAMERYEEAEVLMTRSLEIEVANLGPDNPCVAQSLADLATAILEPAGEYAKAREAAQRAVEILEAAVEPDDFRFLYALMSLGGAVRGTGDLSEALNLSERAIEIQERALGSDHPDTAAMQISKARMLAESGNVAAALELVTQGETVSREHFVLTARSASENEALSYAAGRVSGIDLLTSIAAETGDSAPATIESAWDSVIRARALVLDEMVARRQIARPQSDPELRELQVEATRASEMLARLVITGPGEMTEAEFEAVIDEAEEAKERAERVFAARSGEFRKAFERDRIGYDQVVAALPPETALVAIVRYGKKQLATDPGEQPEPIEASTPTYAAFIATGDSAHPALIELGPATQIEEWIDRWYRLTTREVLSAGRASAVAEAAYRDATIELRQAVWDPIEAKLAGSQRVFVVPDGAFNFLDFSTLPVGDSDYLIEVGPTTYFLSSERDLLMEKPASRSGPLLALGAPDFDSTPQFASLGAREVQVASVATDPAGNVYRGPRSACGSFQSMTFDPLPASGQEVEEILGLWQQVVNDEADTILTGAAASETALKDSASGNRVLHLATHGFFLGGDCGSALSPADGDVSSENPLLLSGLVMAGANHRDAAGPDEDDGILTAEEIATLDLADTEWAVLSACDTGRGEIRDGEGVLGLQRAFRMAGARTIIMSLWPVEDESARGWMSALYSHHFVEGESTMDSAHNASLELLQERRALGLSTHPYYWAGFIASGDWR